MEMSKHVKCSSSSGTRTRTLTDLPESILLHILSFLPTLETPKTSLITRKFRNLWFSLTNLNFSHTHFSIPHHSLASTRLSFVKLVNSFIFLRPSSSPICKFRLQFRFVQRQYTGDITHWLCHLIITTRITELDLDFSNGPSYVDGDGDEDKQEVLYDFPFTLLFNSAVRDFKLRHSSISRILRVTVKIVSLRSLYLECVDLRDEMLCDLMASCVNLESLTLHYCYGMQHLKISSSSLKHLSLDSFHTDTDTDDDDDDDDSSLLIVAPSLYLLSIIAFKVNIYVFEDIASLVEADIKLPYPQYIKVIPLVAHVKRLHGVNYWFQLLEATDFFPKSSILYNLRYLHMLTGYSKSDLLGLAAFLELTPNLDTMILDRQVQFDGDGRIVLDEVIDEQINFNLPSLKQVTIKYYGEPKNEIYLKELLKQQGEVLERVELIPGAPVKPSSSL